MYVVKVALLFIFFVILLISCVWTETLKIFSTFCHFSFEGRGVKKETKGINFFVRHGHFDVAPYCLRVRFKIDNMKCHLVHLCKLKEVDPSGRLFTAACNLTETVVVLVFLLHTDEISSKIIYPL